MDLSTAINWKSKSKLFVSLASRPGKTGETFYSALFGHHNIDADYIACETKDLGRDIKLVREHCAGASITMPFKRSVDRYLDMSRSPTSAVNTVVNNLGFLVGYNCDYLGLKEVLGDSLKDQRVVLLGRGAMAENILELAKSAKQVLQVSRDNWDLRHTDCDILINTTSVGMGDGLSPVDQINAHTVVDCVIGRTRLIDQAESAGAKFITGADIYQAQFKFQFKMYTQQDPDLDVVKLVAKRVFD